MTLLTDPHEPRVDPTISCGECAAVCCRLLVVLMPDDDVPVQMIDRDDRDLEVMARRDDGWCTALDRDTLRCTIYARRPFICREYEMGASECRVDRADWRRIALVVCD